MLNFYRMLHHMQQAGRILPALICLTALPWCSRGLAQVDPAPPQFWKWAATPPMGWNSYDCYGDSVTESEVLANAQSMRDNLLSHGWNYVVVDFRWYDPEPTGDDSLLNRTRLNAELAMDKFGRLQPAPDRFPSSADGKGFKPLADQIHAMGLKFGIHVMRGIPHRCASQSADRGEQIDRVRCRQLQHLFLVPGYVRRQCHQAGRAGMV